MKFMKQLNLRSVKKVSEKAIYMNRYSDNEPYMASDRGFVV